MPSWLAVYLYGLVGIAMLIPFLTALTGLDKDIKNSDEGWVVYFLGPLLWPLAILMILAISADTAGAAIKTRLEARRTRKQHKIASLKELGVKAEEYEV